MSASVGLSSIARASARRVLVLVYRRQRYADTVRIVSEEAAKEAYAKYLQLAPDAKNAPEIKKKLAKM